MWRGRKNDRFGYVSEVVDMLASLRLGTDPDISSEKRLPVLMMPLMMKRVIGGLGPE